MRKYLLFLMIPFLAYAIGDTARTIYTEVISTKASNQDISINPSGTGGVNIGGNAFLKIPSGTTGQQPGSPSAGMIRYNSDDGQFEGYTTEWGAIAGGGAGDVTNLLTDGGFDQDATSGNDGLTCTVGTCSQETTIKLFGEGALKIALSSQAADVSKVYDNTGAQWDYQMVQVEAYLKSSSPFDFCYWDGTTTSNCLTYSGDDTWTKVKIIQQVTTENTVGYKIVSASITDDIYVDASSVSSLKFDGTTKVLVQSYHIEQAGNALTDRTGEPEFNLGTATVKATGDALITAVDDPGNTRTKWVANKKVTLEASTSAENTVASNQVSIIKFNSSGVEQYRIGGTAQSSAVGLKTSSSGSMELEEGEFFTVIYSNDIANNTDLLKVSFTATHYEQKSVLSDASADSTISNGVAYTPTFTGFGSESGVEFEYWRNGELLHVIGRFTAGTTTATEAQITLPIVNGNQLVIGGNTSGIVSCGKFTLNSASSTDVDVHALCTKGDSFINAGLRNGGNNGLTPINGSAAFVSSTDNAVEFTVPIEGWTAKPQIVGTFKPDVYKTKYSTNAGQSIPTASETIVDFEDVEFDKNGRVTTGASWKYTAEESGTYTINAMIMYASHVPPNGAIYYLILYKNGVASDQGVRVLGAADFGSNVVTVPFSASVELAEGDYIDLRAFQNTGAAKSLLAGGTVNYIVIDRDDQAGRLTQSEPKKIQQKSLSANITTNTSDISNLRSSNLTVGKWYKVNAQCSYLLVASGDAFLQFKNNGSVVGRCGTLAITGFSGESNQSGTSFYFKAAATTLTTDALVSGAGNAINQSSGNNGTFYWIEEANVVETNQW